MDALLVFPHQLFIKPKDNTTLIYIEDEHFFKREDIPFHKHKLILHRAAMQSHYHDISAHKIYFEYPLDKTKLFVHLKTYDRILGYDPVDHSLKKTYNHLPIKWLDTPNFINNTETLNAFFSGKHSYFMHKFYVHQRKHHNILMENDKPVGGQYSFDQDNRKKLPKDIDISQSLQFSNEMIKEAITWVSKEFPNNPGTASTFNYPTTRNEALQQLNYFLDYKFQYFGPYQDAFSDEDPFLFHSVLSSSLNIGLLSPKEIVEKALECDVPLQSKEGFIRQIIGWREFMRAVYYYEGETMRNTNYLNHHNRLSNAWYKGKTTLPIVDKTINKLITYAYSHHIERLMVLGNLMMLSNIHPEDVYRYFMAMHIDAYDWVMVPNIYGMSQFASGPMMTTKPYFSGANYLKKMGIKNGPWSDTWDALFYCFLEDHRTLIENNPRLSILIRNLDKKDKTTLTHYHALKEDFLNKITVKKG